MLLTVTLAKMLAEIALLALAGQALLALLAGPGRAANPFYGALRAVTAPLRRAAAVLLPRLAERHRMLAVVLLLALAWLLTTAAKIGLCLEIGLALCR
jgi:hypothetical protein